MTVRLQSPGGAGPGVWQWLEGNTTLLGWLFVLGIGSLVLTVLLLPMIAVRLAPDHFLASRRELAVRGGPVALLVRIGKNVLGFVFLLAGIAMLVLPGQGLLTILIGLLMLDFPGKRALERRIVRRPAILGFLNRLRARHGRPPLLVD
jgi:hypothetical protein